MTAKMLREVADAPEGARHITLSDTLARRLAGNLRVAAADLEADGHRLGCQRLRIDLPREQRQCTCKPAEQGAAPGPRDPGASGSSPAAGSIPGEAR